LIYRVNLNDCTTDSIANLNSNIYDIALSPSGKLYILAACFDTASTDSIYVLDLTSNSVSLLGEIPHGYGTPNSLTCDTAGNLLTIGWITNSIIELILCYIDTQSLAISPICDVKGLTGGDLTYYKGDIYYVDLSDYLHRVTLNPIHDYTAEVIGCSNNVSYGLSNNLLDTASCEPSLFAYSNSSICKISTVTGNSSPWCENIISSIYDQISGAASYPNQPCAVRQTYTMPDAFTPNDDGINDLFYPIVANGAEIIYFKIYNRWGQLIHNSVQPWNGEYNSSPQPEGIYNYFVTISIIDNNAQPVTFSREGTFILMR
jgi:gliding motility-associated-like protein